MTAQTRILVAADDPDLRDILRSVLEPAGFTISEAADGPSTLRTIRGEPPDLVIMDYLMPGLTGPEVCAQLKQDLLLRHLPIIMLTGKSELQDKVHGINAGADDYLIKPFKKSEITVKVGDTVTVTSLAGRERTNRKASGVTMINIGSASTRYPARQPPEAIT